MKNKKSIATGRLILLLIAVVVALILFYVLPDLLGKGKKETETLLGSSVDYDQDGVANYFDKCKCTFAETDNGCPDDTYPEISGHKPYCDCPTEMSPDGVEEKCDYDSNNADIGT